MGGGRQQLFQDCKQVEYESTNSPSGSQRCSNHYLQLSILPMKHLIMSLLLLTGVAAKAQNFQEHKRGDTTFYLIPDYFDQFEFMAGKHSMDIGYVGDQVYRFSVHRETQTVFAVPVSKQWPNVGMSYPRQSSHSQA